MALNRKIFKHSGILMTFWSSSRSWDNIHTFLIMCHGCPSHPFDHVPVHNEKLLEEGVILVYPNYIGTWGSDGECTFDNSVETVLEVIKFVKNGSGEEGRSKKTLNWNANNIILIGASFGGSVVLCAGAQSADVSKIISCSPVIDWSQHGLEIGESSLEETAMFISETYNQLWRCSSESLDRFSRGDIKINPISYIKELKSKNILLIHDRNDPQISWKKVYDFSKKINPNTDDILYSQDIGRHILLNHLDEPILFERVKIFILA